MTLVSVFLADACAFGITAPEGSVIVPESVAPVTCARVGTEIRKLRASAANIRSLKAKFELRRTGMACLLGWSCAQASETSPRQKDSFPSVISRNTHVCLLSGL